MNKRDIEKEIKENAKINTSEAKIEESIDAGSIKKGDKGSDENPIKSTTEFVNFLNKEGEKASLNPDNMKVDITDVTPETRKRELLKTCALLPKGSIARYIMEARILGASYEDIAKVVSSTISEIKRIEKRAVQRISDALLQREKSELIIIDEYYKRKFF